MRNLVTTTVLLGLLTALLPAAPSAALPKAPEIVLSAGVAGQDCGDLASNAAKLAAAGQSGTATCLRKGRTQTAGTGASISAVCGGSSVVKRNGSCIVEDGILVIYLIPSGDVIGSIGYTVESLTTLNHNSLSWTESFNYRADWVAGTGLAVTNTSIYAEPRCFASCLITGSGLIGGSAMPGFPQSTSGTFNSPPAGFVWEAQSGWEFWFGNPAWANGASNHLTTTPGRHRCDNSLSSLPAGCVYPSIRPVHEIPRLRYPKYAEHIRQALGFGLPDVLTRTTNESIKNLNHSTACPSGYPNPQPGVLTCDEYPFQSTLNGAFSQPYGRNIFLFNWNTSYLFDCMARWLPRRAGNDPGGYSSCLIPAGENSGGGSDLGNFYYTSRVIDGDQFQVRVV